jgi:PAS domain-containing protein
LREEVPIDTRPAQRDIERTAFGRARVGHDGLDLRRQVADDARVCEDLEQVAFAVHHGVLFDAKGRPTARERALGEAAGITPACSIATRASVANTGAATTLP